MPTAEAGRSLADLYPTIAKEWHKEKNTSLGENPNTVKPSSHLRVTWQCENGHEWETRIRDRIDKKTGKPSRCRKCTKRAPSPEYNLAKEFPDVAKQWDYIANIEMGTLNDPSLFSPGSTKKVQWKCPNNPEHLWGMRILDRTRNKQGCPYCAGKRVAKENSLLVLFPDIAKEWDYEANTFLGDKNGPEHFTRASGEKLFWKCEANSSHHWSATISDRTANKSNCPICSGRIVSDTNRLSLLFPDIAKEWDYEANALLGDKNGPEFWAAKSAKKVGWICDLGHRWTAAISNRTSNESGCPTCAQVILSDANRLSLLFPDVAREWDYEANTFLEDKNGPEFWHIRSSKKVGWICHEKHKWEMSIRDKVDSQSRKGKGCGICSGKVLSEPYTLSNRFPHIAKEWDYEANAFLGDKNGPEFWHGKSMQEVNWKCEEGHKWPFRISSRTTHNSACPGCSKSTAISSRYFLRKLIEAVLPQINILTEAEMWRLVAELPGTMPRAIREAIATRNERALREFIGNVGIEDSDDSEESKEVIGDFFTRLRTQLGNQLRRGPSETSSPDDLKAFFERSRANKMWSHAFAGNVDNEIYWNESLGDDDRFWRFQEEYDAVRAIELPADYQGEHEPNLMQRYVMWRLQQDKAFGNWSGTGAGKTLSAILGGSIVGAKRVLVICPNQTVDGWESTILDAFPASEVQKKTFNPVWQRISSTQYVVLNVEMLQLERTRVGIADLLGTFDIDYVIIDEVHFLKQRKDDDDMSQRRRNFEYLLRTLRERNPALHVLGMSATPIINTLHEGISLVELITGQSTGIVDKDTDANALALYSRMIDIGVRWMPAYESYLRQFIVEIDGTPAIEQMRNISLTKKLPFELELTRLRLPTIIANTVRKTVIYTGNIGGGIADLLEAEISRAGWSVGFYTGEDKSGLDAFINGDLDVLIGTSAMSTGLDGLQRVSSRLIMNSVPPTAAEFDQIKGRLHRQGQSASQILLVIPQVWLTDERGETVPIDGSRLRRLERKRSLADAALEGIPPDHTIGTREEMEQKIRRWLKGQIHADEVIDSIKPHEDALPDDEFVIID